VRKNRDHKTDEDQTDSRPAVLRSLEACFAASKKTGISLVFVGLVIAVLPHTVSILFGRYVLKMNPVIVLGACSGAGTITAALRASRKRRKATSPLSLYRALRHWQYRAHGMGTSLVAMMS